jgi:hypothetical protein
MTDTEPEVPPSTDHPQKGGEKILKVRPHPLTKKISALDVVHRSEEAEDHIEELGDVSGRIEATRTSLVPNSSSDAHLQDRKNYAPLDGGYGWVVVFGCFLMHVINVGLIKSFGIIFVDLREKFNASSYDTSWIYSLFLVCSTWFGKHTNFPPQVE